MTTSHHNAHPSTDCDPMVSSCDFDRCSIDSTDPFGAAPFVPLTDAGGHADWHLLRHGLSGTRLLKGHRLCSYAGGDAKSVDRVDADSVGSVSDLRERVMV